VVSENNFPAAAGLASSASGFAALTLACAKALGMNKTPEELSIYARIGSGSACRSVMGGFVEWKKGVQTDGKDSYAVQLRPANRWRDMVDVIGITRRERKKVSSRDGMRQTVLTSELFKERLRMLPGRLTIVRKAIANRDLATLLKETMADSDNMHACMADTKPPIIYMNDISHYIADAVRQLNVEASNTIAGYTFDAGPNAHVITQQKYVPLVRRMLSRIHGVQEIIVAGIGEGPHVK
jgi:diphosphomevalonate decarboxylase